MSDRRGPWVHLLVLGPPQCRADRWPFEGEPLIPDKGSEEGTVTGQEELDLREETAGY